MPGSQLAPKPVDPISSDELGNEPSQHGHHGSPQEAVVAGVGMMRLVLFSSRRRAHHHIVGSAGGLISLVHLIPISLVLASALVTTLVADEVLLPIDETSQDHMSPSQADESLTDLAGCFPGFSVANAAWRVFHAFDSSQRQFQNEFA